MTSPIIDVKVDVNVDVDVGEVLYVDHRGVASPLSVCYHATASRVLSSGYGVGSTLREIDTVHCPQCGHYASHASTLRQKRGTCPEDHCRLCPVCQVPVSVRVVAGPTKGGLSSSLSLSNTNTNVCVYRCGYCRWTSDEVGVHTKVPKSSSRSSTSTSTLSSSSKQSKQAPEPPKVDRNRNDNSDPAWKQMAEDLAMELQTQCDVVEMETGATDAFKKLVDGWGKKAQEEQRRRRYGTTVGTVVTKSSLLSTSTSGIPEEDDPSSVVAWSVEALEAETKRRRAALAPGEPPMGVVVPHRNDGLLRLPSRIPLLARCSRRCRAEMEAGRPGILVRPKTHPLEGDSSQRGGQAGQWFKKDSSAVLTVPRVRSLAVNVLSSSTSSSSSSSIQRWLWSVSNPTLGLVRLRLRLDNTAFTESGQRRVVRDSRRGNGGVCTGDLVEVDADCVSLPPKDVMDTLTTDMVELEPMEDALLELGKPRRNRLPPAVESWAEPTDGDHNDDDASSPSSCVLKVLATSVDVAWIELRLPASTETFETQTQTPYRSLGLSMDIEVGNGSWESTFIKPRPDVTPDYVTFPLVFLWKGPEEEAPVEEETQENDNDNNNNNNNNGEEEPEPQGEAPRESEEATNEPTS